VTRRDRWVLLLGAIALASLAGYSARFLKISTDISHFIPDSDDPHLARISRELARSRPCRWK